MRRQLEYIGPYKVTHSTLEDGKSEYKSVKDYFSKVSVYTTKRGVVIVFQMDWQTNFGKDIFTSFVAVVDGLKYRAYLPEILKSDRSVKWWATHFIKNIPK